MKLGLSPGAPWIYLLAILLIPQCQTFIVREILVNEPVTFPCTCYKNQPEVQWTRFIPTLAVIATCDSKTCQTEQAYQKRCVVAGNTSSGNFSLWISSVVYSDVGSYKCTCNGDIDTEVKLKVYVPTVIKAFEGENVRLPCYTDTRRDAKDVHWKKDGRIFLEYVYAIKNEASAGRFKISEEGFPDGDLSLHIASVNLSDAGFYLCLIHDESRDGDPRAVLLMVEKQPENQQPTCPTTIGLAVTLGLVILIDIIGMIVYCWRKRRVPQNTTSTNLSAPVQEEFHMIPKPSSTLPIQD